MNSKRLFNTYITTRFANSGRIAGDGVMEDNYDEDSCSKLHSHPKRPSQIFDNLPDFKAEPVYTYDSLGNKILLVETAEEER